MRRHGHALRAFAEAKGTQPLLDTLRAQILALGAVHVRVGTDQAALQESLAGRPGFVERLPTGQARFVAVVLPPGIANAPEIETSARDLILDVAPLVASSERAGHADRRGDAAGHALVALAEPRREGTEAGTLASPPVGGARAPGGGAIVRLAAVVV